MEETTKNEPTNPTPPDDSSADSGDKSESLEAYKARFEDAKRARDEERRKRKDLAARVEELEKGNAEYKQQQEQARKSQLEKKGQYEVLIQEFEKEKHDYHSKLLGEVQRVRMGDLRRKVTDVVGTDDPQYLELALQKVAGSLSLLDDVSQEPGGYQIPSLSVEPSAVDAAVKVLRKEFPRLFKATTAGGEPVTASVTKSGPANDPNDPAERVRLLAQQYSYSPKRK